MADRAQVDVKINGDASGLSNAVDQASTKVEGFATGVLKKMGGAMIAAFSVQAVIGFVKETLAAADALQDLSENTGIGVEKLQTYQVLARRSGVEFQTLVGVFGKLEKASAEALTKTGPMREAFKGLGIEIDSLNGKNPAEIFEMISAAMARMGYSAEATRIKFELMGKTGLGLNTILKDVSKGTDELTKSLVKSGLVLSAEAQKRLDEMNKLIEENIIGMKNVAKESMGKSLFSDAITAALMNDKIALEKGITSNFFQAEGGYFQKFWEKFGEIYYNKKYFVDLEVKTKLPKPNITPLDIDLKAGDKEEAYELKKWESKLARMKKEDQLKELMKAKDVQEMWLGLATKNNEKEEQLKYKDLLLDTTNKIFDIQVKINEETEKQIQNSIELNEQEDRLADRYEDEVKNRNRQLKDVDKEGNEDRFNELQRIGGQIGGQPNVAVGNAVRSLALEEKRTRIIEDSDKKLNDIRIAVEKVADKKWETTLE